MSELSSAAPARGALAPILELAGADPRYGELVTALGEATPGRPAADIHTSASLRPFLIAALLEDSAALEGRAALLVTADDVGARDLTRELRAYLARPVRFYPSRGTGYESQLRPPAHLVGLRLAALDALEEAGESPPVIVASAIALSELIPGESLRPHGSSVAVGAEVDLDELAGRLVEAGYERVDQVEDRGQFAVRGDILDVFPATEERAARIELFGDEVESIRWFSTFTQRSLGDTTRVDLDPAAELDAEHRELIELAMEDEDESADPLAVLPLEEFIDPLSLFGPDTAVVLTASDEIEPTLKAHHEDIEAAIGAESTARLYTDAIASLEGRALLALSSTPAGQAIEILAQPIASPARTPAEAEAELERHVRDGYRVIVAFEHAGEAERTQYNLQRLEAPPLAAGPPRDPGVRFAEANVQEAFASPAMKLAVLPWRKLLHRRRARAEAPARGAMTSFTDLRVGDIVVHEDHGIARFSGFETKTVGSITRDYLHLAYRGDDKVFVPADQLAKISRYVGAGGAEPQLSKLGGRSWEQLKSRARRAAQELAGELLNLYAERRARPGHAFSPDGEWQMRLEASFPYRETADQIDAIDAVKEDMERPTPMDRLICGDVGYGKTEVAIRAAFKAASEGKQVMMLVPTTILAQQHLGTFRERLRDFPVEVDMISRLRRPAEVKATLTRFAEGKVDILIGTHRVLSRDVRWDDLGLVIVDEEQRFGVKQKELLRQLKLKVDVLSLSATPIPRTLQMSLAGLRDISVIETPPEGRRPVRTYVGPWDEELVVRAINREIEREGQAFFLHNRIDTLGETVERLRALCPGTRFATAHGQMDESELEETMLGFMRGDADVLVATTIIESGLDIPTANTLIVERSDLLGLAQAYQIRGRVGRSRERAFAYMLYPSTELLTPEAGARLSTLSDHTELGSGFAIAMRDLELRGAGDLLGEEQSGHVAAVGFELYMQMLEEAVEILRSSEDGAAPERQVRMDLNVDAYVPADWIPFEAARIDVHRRAASAREPARLAALRAELRDRFGAIPDSVENLLELQRIRLLYARAGVASVEVRGGKLSVTPVEIDSEAVSKITEEVPKALYEWRQKTLSARVENDPADRLDTARALAQALDAAMLPPS